MNIELHDPQVKVRVTYSEIDGLRFAPGSWSDRVVEWQTISAEGLVVDREVKRIYLTGRGTYVKKDGTVGLQTTSMRFGSLGSLPTEWQDRIYLDLSNLAEKVTVSA